MRLINLWIMCVIITAAGCETPTAEVCKTPTVDTVAFLADLDASMKSKGDQVLVAVGEVSTNVAEIADAQQRIVAAIETLKAERAAVPESSESTDPDPDPAAELTSFEADRPKLWITYADGFACPPCDRLKADIAAGLFDDFEIVLEPIGSGLRTARPAIRFAWPTSQSGYAAMYEYSPAVRNWLRSNLLSTTSTAAAPGDTVISLAAGPVAQSAPVRQPSQSDLVALHNQLHGGGQWTWPGDLATHLKSRHGVSLQTGGEPVVGSLFQDHRASAVLSQRSRVATVSRGENSSWWSRNTVRVKNSACPTCPR